MGKRFFLAVIVPVLLLGGCTQEGAKQADSVSGATARRGPPAPVFLERFMPQAMADGMVKIAVLVNMEEGDSSRQFIEGCVSEGRALSFTVDTFVSGADEKRCREIAAGIAQADYDGLIFSNGFASGKFDGANGGVADFSYDILRPVAEKGIHIVTFEALPYRDGKSIKGLIATFQDDYRLARLSLETLLAYNNSEGRPARVIRAGGEPGITFLDRRAWEFEQMVSAGKIEETALIKIDNLKNPHSAAWEGLAALLPRFPPGSVDAVWVPWDEFAAGCAEALASAGRHDIKLVSIGISDDDIRLMQRHADIWLASAAVDPKLAGTVNMRLLAASLAGEDISASFSFDPQLVKTAELNPAVNMANISALMPGWGDGQGLFDHYQWMDELKAAGVKYLRIPPPAAERAQPKAAL
jgi:simple sugar transport system substrate-binding protein